VDADPYDRVCDHLIVQEQSTGQVVGTYRLQPGSRAAQELGYYSEREFDFGPYQPLRGQMVELGRACVHQAHRNLHVLGLLWRGIASYASLQGARYLIGCSSLHTQDPAQGASAYSELYRHHLVPPTLRTRPQPQWECPLRELAENAPELPKLLRTYLAVGARICGPPALDREFGTIDFLTLIDLEELPPAVRARFFGEPAR
jgi:putative hemolysin